MISLPVNYKALVQVKEFPHDPSLAICCLRLKNDNDQYLGWYQTIRTQHGIAPSSMLETALADLEDTIDLNTDPYIDKQSLITEAPKDQHWVSVTIPGGLPVAEYRLQHGLPEPVDD